MRKVNKEPGCVGINLAITIANSVEHFTGTVVKNYANNNDWDASEVQGDRNNILARGRVGGGGRSSFEELIG